MNRSAPIIPNRLLDYRTREQLSRMGKNDWVLLFDDLFSGEPSEASWQAICELFAVWPRSEERQLYLERAGEIVANWDERLTVLSSASRYLYEAESLSELASLAKSIDLYRREEHGSSELIAIATSKHVRRLARLSIRHSEISNRAWQALIDSAYLTNLRHLHIISTVMSSDDARGLLERGSFVKLQCLKLINVGLRDRSLAVAAQSIPFTELRTLDLSNNTLGDDGALLISRAPWRGRIQRMALRHNYITAPAMRALISSLSCGQAKQLDLSENRATDTEKAALLELAHENNIALTI